MAEVEFRKLIFSSKHGEGEMIGPSILQYTGDYIPYDYQKELYKLENPALVEKLKFHNPIPKPHGVPIIKKGLFYRDFEFI